MNYHSIQELIDAAEKEKTSISEIVIRDQMEELECSREALLQRMEKRFSVMQDSVKAGMAPDLRSTSGLTGGEASKMNAYAEKGGILGPFFNHAVARAVAVSEYNAAMGRIVAAPTAGSCGILPGVLVSMLEEGKASREACVKSLFTSAGIGIIIAEKASLAGAQGGCQAECGSACGMAAAALTELCGGTPAQAGHACAIALQAQLGLVCDPVAGLVEIPCIKRNASGTTLAFMAAEMALSGVIFEIPVDQVIDAMKEVGDSLPCSLRETAMGGLAATPEGRRLARQVFS